jgi:hypothetical protein
MAMTGMTCYILHRLNFYNNDEVKGYWKYRRILEPIFFSPETKCYSSEMINLVFKNKETKTKSSD